MRRKFREWLKYPRGLPLALFYAATVIFIACAAIFTAMDRDFGVLPYVFYALAAVSLGYSVYTIVIFAPKIKKKAIAILQSNPFTERLYRQYGFRTIVFAIFSFIISLGNAIFNGVFGILYRSVWYGALGGYYLFLSAMRGGVLLYRKNNKKRAETETDLKKRLRETKSYTICGIFLLLMPLALTGVMLEIFLSDRAFVHAGLTIYVAAAYTFYKIIMSVVHFFKARKGDDRIVRAIRNVNLADALVSVFALQTAMFYEFSAGKDFGSANVVTGAVVCLITAAIGVFMTVNGFGTLRKIKSEEGNNLGKRE